MKASKMITYLQPLMGRLLFVISLLLVQSCSAGDSSSQPATNSQKLTASTTQPDPTYFDFTNATDANRPNLRTDQQLKVIKNLPLSLWFEIKYTNIHTLIFSADRAVNLDTTELIKQVKHSRVKWVRLENPGTPGGLSNMDLSSYTSGPTISVSEYLQE